ncbi:MAG TPA: proline racemase family protein [Candidatus Eisenbacteria bacterium]|nr:proline racemase family protein [Candidatus Eisenbacteria bacterium]
MSLPPSPGQPSPGEGDPEDESRTWDSVSDDHRRVGRAERGRGNARPGRITGAIRTVDYHTGGEPFRIVVDGAPDLEGRTVLERRAWAAAHLDHVRHLLIDEPRGHADMYGAYVTLPNDSGADLGVVFFHNEGYSTACGHGTIALVTWALESGRLAASEPSTAVTVDVPSGRLACVARVRGNRVERVRFRNVPSFVVATGVEVTTTRGTIPVDVAYGGAFYGSVDVQALGLDVSAGSLPDLIALQRELRPALDAALDPWHPEEPELRGIYGIVFWQREARPKTEVTLVQRNVTVFADGEVDRSPCGSGTSARLALLDASGELARGAALEHRSIVHSVFLGRVVGDGPPAAGRATVITEVEGSAFLTGRHEFVLDPADPLGTGFLLR